MTTDTQKKLNQINIDFYQQTATHFDKTRQYAWKGWTNISNIIKYNFNEPLNVLDIGCGNGRFAKFLHKESHKINSYLGIDQNNSLLTFANQNFNSPKIHFETANLLKVDYKNKYNKQYNLITLFGVMHHIPSFKKRVELITDLYQILKPNGILAISFWDFMTNDRIKSKIVPWNTLNINQDEIETNDYLLDWKRGTNAIRYCHFTDDDEIEKIIQSVNANDIKQFYADGKSEKLNRYLVFSDQIRS